jgi:hypothetical protein
MSATQILSGPGAAKRRPTRSGAGSDALGAARRAVATTDVHALQPSVSHQPGHTFAGQQDPMVQPELSPDPRCPVGAARALMDLTDQLRERAVVDLATRRRPPGPGVEARA